MDLSPSCTFATKTISHAKIKTITVLIAVAKSELTFFMPTLDNTAVIPAKKADKTAKVSHITNTSLPLFYHNFFMPYIPFSKN